MTWATDVLGARDTWGRAPSAHNTQPGIVSADADELVVDWDPARELVVADPTRRDLWLSLGALAESLVITAADLGHRLEVAWEVDARAHHAARLTRLSDATPGEGVPGEGEPGEQPFSGADLRGRRTARGPYLEPFATPDQVADVARTALATPVRPAEVVVPPQELPDATVTALTALPPALVTDLLPRADSWSWSSPAQVAELRSWLRLSPDHPAYRLDGLTDRALAITPTEARLLAAASHPRSWALLRRLGGPSLMARASAQEGLGTVAAFHVPADAARTPAQVAELGRVLLRLWLSAQRHGLHVHPLSQLVDASATAAALHEHLPGRRILSVFRLGLPAREPVRSHRLA